jgi:hypothetical protein
LAGDCAWATFAPLAPFAFRPGEPTSRLDGERRPERARAEASAPLAVRLALLPFCRGLLLSISSPLASERDREAGPRGVPPPQPVTGQPSYRHTRSSLRGGAPARLGRNGLHGLGIPLATIGEMRKKAREDERKRPAVLPDVGCGGFRIRGNRGGDLRRLGPTTERKATGSSGVLRHFYFGAAPFSAVGDCLNYWAPWACSSVGFRNVTSNESAAGASPHDPSVTARNPPARGFRDRRPRPD